MEDTEETPYYLTFREISAWLNVYKFHFKSGSLDRTCNTTYLVDTYLNNIITIIIWIIYWVY